ncbi:MAG: hypothetical protein IJA71_04595 [Clostridia bacterium]|nr:hypothetical protein [Clostridia bacterium]
MADTFYDPKKNEEYQKALEKLEAARKEKPTYADTYGAQVRDLQAQLTGRSPFTYSIDKDALFRQYRDRYQSLGRRAMEDTMGRAQAMTGGYGNSYAQTVGQQSYQSYLKELSEVAPKLYEQALDRYKQEGRDLQSRYEAAKSLEQEEYSRHKDALDAYRKDLSYLQTQADQAYDRGYQQYLEEYKQAEDRYSRLLYMMEKLGYKPTEAELLAAGLTKDQAKAFMK